ncbi:MAG TPA: helix-turn-helix domain-containing protein [Vicinamibacterales bacterium]|nr:helix-turn-helix domain-containing protein [Vicinamibacterales bacterium]
MKRVAPESFGRKLKALREAAGFTQEELATIAGLSVHAVSALERGERRRPHVETVRALSAALDLSGASRDAFLASARTPPADAAADELSGLFLPRPLTPIVGRDGEMERLQQWLAAPVTRLVTIVGPGGVGKTRLALEVARAVAERAESRVVFVSLASVGDSAFVGPAVAEAHGLTDVSALDLPKHLRAAYGDRPTLLVLDNFEHVLESAPLVADLLHAIPALQLLVTSRAPLHVRGERQYTLGPLPLDRDSEMLSPADLAGVPAVRLFLDRVRDVQPDFRLTPANGATVAAICRQLDALPLAIELTAPWIKVLSPDELLRRLRHDVLLEAVGSRDLPERQQTINATVAWSYQLLDPPGQRAFRRLSVLPGPFSIDAAEAVLARPAASAPGDTVLAAVSGLIDKSLLLRSESSNDATRPLYRMLETVHAYAKAALAESTELDDAQEELTQYCIGEASSAAAGLVGVNQCEWLDRSRADFDSHRAALRRLIDRGRLAEAAGIASGLMWFWVIRGHAREGLHWYERILQTPSLPPAMESRTLIGSALMRYVQVDLDRARTDLTRAAALARNASKPAIVAQADVTLGHVEHMAGHLDAARACFLRAIDNPGARDIPWVGGSALTGLAWTAIERGNANDEAARLLDDATTSLRDAGPWFLLLVGFLRTTIAVRQQQPDEVFSSALESLHRIRELRDQFAFVYTLAMLAAAAALKGETTWVARLLGARDSASTRTDAGVVDQYLADLLRKVEGDARARLGPAAWAQAYAAGGRASIDDLIEDIARARSNVT